MTFQYLTQHKRRVCRIVLVLLVLSCLSKPIGTWATSECEETVLTEGATAYNALNVQAFGQYVVWVDFQWDEIGTHDYTIHIYDTETGVVETIQKAVGPETVPDFADGRLVWTGPVFGHGEVYLYDLSTGTIRQLSNLDGVPSFAPPHINGSTVYWETWREDLASAIVLYDLNSAETRHVALEAYNDFPQPNMEGDTLVWVDLVDEQAEIMQYNVNTHMITQLTDNQRELDTGSEGYILYHNPQISGDLIVWQRETATRMEDGSYVYLFEWFLYDGRETRLVANSGFLAFLNAPYVVWSSGDGHDAELFLHNIDSGSTVQITDNDFDDYTAEIRGDQVVWGSYSEGIYLYDILTGERTIISDTEGVGAPHLGDGFITWLADVDLHGGNVALCMY